MEAGSQRATRGLKSFPEEAQPHLLRCIKLCRSLWRMRSVSVYIPYENFVLRAFLSTFGPSSTKPSLCDIREFHPNDNITPSVSVVEVTTGKSRVAAFMLIADDAKSAKKLVPKWTKFVKSWKKKQDAIRP